LTPSSFDFAVTPLVSLRHGKIIEPDAGQTQQMQFAVSLSHPIDQPVTFDFMTEDNGPTIDAGIHYDAVSRVVEIPAGETSVTVTVPVHGNDDEGKALDGFAASIANITNALPGVWWVPGWIIDNDGTNQNPQPMIIAGDGIVREGPEGAVTILRVPVELTMPSANEVRVNYETRNAGPSVIPGMDYVTTAGQLVFPAGSVLEYIDVPVIGDTLTETNEYFYIDFSGVVNAILYPGVGTGRILDGDPCHPLISRLEVRNNSNAGRDVKLQGFRLLVGGNPNREVVIEYKNSLSDTKWAPLKTNMVGQVDVEFIDLSSTNRTRRFYRVIER
jgi:hypothetical protein